VLVVRDVVPLVLLWFTSHSTGFTHHFPINGAGRLPLQGPWDRSAGRAEWSDGGSGLARSPQCARLRAVGGRAGHPRPR